MMQMHWGSPLVTWSVPRAMQITAMSSSLSNTEATLEAEREQVVELEGGMLQRVWSICCNCLLLCSSADHVKYCAEALKTMNSQRKALASALARCAELSFTFLQECP